jgi:hypothetical protein
MNESRIELSIPKLSKSNHAEWKVKVDEELLQYNEISDWTTGVEEAEPEFNLPQYQIAGHAGAPPVINPHWLQFGGEAVALDHYREEMKTINAKKRDFDKNKYKAWAKIISST